MKKAVCLLAMIISVSGLKAQQQEGKKNIEKLCGCFDIEFKYAETFSPDPNYKFHDREEMTALELGLPILNTDKKITIQHLLVLRDTLVIKHWREDWVYEQNFLWIYKGDKNWVKQELRPEQYKGKWTQTIWEVDDAPRYQGISDWVTTDGKTFWQTTTDAPLPRREYTVRSDYNILKRGNRLILTENGWMHEQDNEKILAKDNKRQVIAQEKGYNIYKRAPEKDCAFASKWWDKQKNFWVAVRQEWDALLNSTDQLHLQTKVDNRLLHQHFDELASRHATEHFSVDVIRSETRKLLNKFVKTSSGLASN